MRQGRRVALVRGIRRWDLVALMINCIIGAGIFGLPSKVFALTGTYSLLAFFVCALVVIVIAFCFAEVASRFRGTGGPYLYAVEAFGSLVGFQVGWLTWLARLTSCAFICNLQVSYLSYFWSPLGTGVWRGVIMTAMVVTLTSINVIGVSRAAAVSNILSIGKLIPLLLFIVAGLFSINPHSFSFASPPALGAFSLAVSQLFVIFTGFELALITAGEARDPQHNMPFAMMTALVVVVVFYVLIQFVCIGTLPNLAVSEKPLADAGQLFLGAVGAAMITIGAMISTTGTLNAILLAGSRLPFAMAEHDHLPRILSSTHQRFHTPHISILLTAGIGLALAVSGTFTYALTLAAVSKLVTSATTCAALPIFRRNCSQPALFKLPAGLFFSTAGVVLCIWLVANTGWHEVRDVGVAAAVGVLVWFVHMQKLR